MPLSTKNIVPLLLDLNQNIDEYADSSVLNIFERPENAVSFYPPNGGLTEPELAQLKQLNDHPDLRNALRKVLADNTASVVFQLFCVLDGVAEPKNDTDDFSDVRITDQEDEPGAEEFMDMLHDSFLDHYWEWREKRGDKTWKLDNL